MRIKRLFFVGMIATYLGIVSTAGLAAEQEISSEETTKQDEPLSQVGITAYGLRGIHRVGVPVSSAPAIMLTGSAGYGYTESIGTIDGAHHRLRGIFGASVSIMPWLAFGFNLDGRYDIHPNDDTGGDSGFVGDPRITLRGGYALSDSFQLGAEAIVWIPGGKAPSLTWDATTVDAKLLAAVAPKTAKWTIAALAGFRFDNSANSAPNPDRTRQGDRLALGISDSNAVLVGVGASYHISAFELIGELTWDVLVGSDAPTVSDSPLRLDIGARYSPIQPLAIELLAETGLSGRPGVIASDPFVPVEPRFTIIAGIRYVWDFSKTDTKTVGPRQVETERVEQPKTQIPPDMPAAKARQLLPIPEEQPGSQLRGLVRSFDGKGLKARITIDPLGTTIKSDEKGYFVVDVPPGNYTVTIETPGYKTQTKKVQIEENGVSILNMDLRVLR